MRKTVVFDFDGVIHSYKLGWTGLTDIPSEPTPGINNLMKELLNLDYEVVIVSTRSATPEGKNAMEEWLLKNNIPYSSISSTKPPAIAYVDDRAINFDGNCEGLLEKILHFRSWIERD